jgi:hypothetical protein
MRMNRPPILRIGHQRSQVGFDRGKIERLEGLGIVEFRAQRVGQTRIAVQHADIELLGPPITVAMPGLRAFSGLAAVVDRAFASTGACGAVRIGGVRVAHGGLLLLLTRL